MDHIYIYISLSLSLSRSLSLSLIEGFKLTFPGKGSNHDRRAFWIPVWAQEFGALALYPKNGPL